VEQRYNEDLDMAALHALKDDERRQAEELLIERMKEEDDFRVRRRSRSSG